MPSDIIYRYLDEKEIDTYEYMSFFEKFHGKGSFNAWKNKIHWYYRRGAYRVLAAIVDGNYVGQSTGYMANAIVNGEEIEIWWSIDTFVLAEMRGRSIGKKLQEKLHQDLPNFTSVSYSRLNGIIKRKCGAEELLDVSFSYYPISCYLTLLLDLAIKKTLNRGISFPKIRIPFLYLNFNRAFYRLNDFNIRELPKEQFAEEVSDFMELCLKEECFHIVRSIDFLRWKYRDNPMITFHALSISKQGERVGVIVLSEVYEGQYLVTKARLIKVLDFVVKPAYRGLRANLLHLALKYCRKQWKLVPDGVLSAQPIRYFPSLTYPKVTHMLSTLKTEKKIKSGYVSYIDQDMERMY